MDDDDDLKPLRLVGLELTLADYRDVFLDGDPPLYEQEELRFGCTRCGHCCARPGDIYLTDEDMERIAAVLSISRRQFSRTYAQYDGSGWLMQVTGDRACPFFVDRQCAVHAAKPVQCRTYPFWPEVVGTRHTWDAEAAECEGINQGRAFSAREVEALLVGLTATDPQPAPGAEP